MNTLSRWQWLSIGVSGLILFVAAFAIFVVGIGTRAAPLGPLAPLLEERMTTAATPTPSATPSPTATDVAMLPTATVPPTTPTLPPYVLPTSIPDGSVVDLAADPLRMGWTSRAPDGTLANSFPDYILYAGALQGTVYLSAAAFPLPDLSSHGLTVAAELLLFGLNDEYLGSGEGAWLVEFLAEPNAFWSQLGFATLAEAPAAQTIAVLYAAELAPGQPVHLALDEAAVQLINRLRYQGVPLIVRLRGADGTETLFGFDGGVGAGSRGNPPRLLLSMAAVEATPTPLVVTATPTPEHVLTADAAQRRAALEEELVGTATPPPFNQVTATPAPTGSADLVLVDGALVPVLVPTSTPANAATAEMQRLEATAIARTTGTATPLPDHYVTATPTATPIVMTATPTPENVLTQVAMVLAATARAQSGGTPTPLPPGVVVVTPTPAFYVVTETPVPQNEATAVVLAAQATLDALLTGTPAAPLVLATATPTMTPIPLEIPLGSLTPTPTLEPSPTPGTTIPEQLHNKILFLSDRAGSEQVYALDPVSGAVSLVTQRWPYDLAEQQLGTSPDGLRRALVAADDNRQLQIQVYSAEYDVTHQLTTFSDATSYDPAWSPTGEWIAFVSTEADNDEIYIISPEGSVTKRLTHNTWEWDKHPSWSPDGTQIVFWSNRDSGRSQIWIMDADGANPRNLSNSTFNDWAPIWVP